MIRKVQLILADQEKPDRERVAEAVSVQNMNMS